MNNEPQDYTKPVAYDAEGRPLYAHPPAQQVPPQQPVAPVSPQPAQPQPQPVQQPQSVDPQAPPAPPQVVQLTRAAEPAPQHISEEAKARHAESVRKYPNLNLSEGEYIINEVRRHPIGLVPIVGVAGFVILLVLLGLAVYPAFELSSGAGTIPTFGSILLPAILLIVLAALGGYIAVWVYLSNKFFLTNESVVQEIQTSLFAHHEQTVSLQNIEDASYRQVGIIQTLFDYGSIRLSTEGDETTYRFNYVANPKKQIATLNNAVEAFKNGRPVSED